MTESKTIQTDDVSTVPAQKLLVSGFVHLKPGCGPVELRREMLILTIDGQEAGMIAAVVVNCHEREVTHVLLGRVPPTSEYRLIPISLISQVSKEAVWLRITVNGIEDLPLH